MQSPALVLERKVRSALFPGLPLTKTRSITELQPRHQMYTPPFVSVLVTAIANTGVELLEFSEDPRLE